MNGPVCHVCEKEVTAYVFDLDAPQVPIKPTIICADCLRERNQAYEVIKHAKQHGLPTAHGAWLDHLAETVGLTRVHGGTLDAESDDEFRWRIQHAIRNRQ